MGETRQVEILYPSMYFGIEKHRDEQGMLIDDTTYAVNNIYLNGVRVAAVIPSGDARYYLTDQVDSVKVIVDDNGLPVTRMEYLPYGETWFQEGDENNAPKYNSQELDKETGYYFYNARHYDPEIVRFVTSDTAIDGVFDTQGWNRFSYTKGNPILYKDPTGHFSILAVLVIGDSISKGVSKDIYAANAGSDSGDPAKANVENDLQKAKGSGDRTTGNSAGKEPDVTVTSTIEGNLYDDSGNVVGMYGKQEIFYRNRAGEIETDVVDYVEWREDNPNAIEEEKQQKPYEHPAAPGIYKMKEAKYGNKIEIEHPEDPGDDPKLKVKWHRYGRSEGCIISSDTDAGDQIREDVKNRVKEGENLTIQLEVIDKRNEFIEKLEAPLPY
ncbi:MAG: RHS repeat-associated core domain-containing protein [Spirochaetota bacterium]|nr:RHS repeat-associated core domain-containing protein [Spirochaetota bacterium]